MMNSNDGLDIFGDRMWFTFQLYCSHDLVYYFLSDLFTSNFIKEWPLQGLGGQHGSYTAGGTVIPCDQSNYTFLFVIRTIV